VKQSISPVKEFEGKEEEGKKFFKNITSLAKRLDELKKDVILKSSPLNLSPKNR
jgi:hypothetical protein